jgi:Fic family protein
MSRLDPDQIIDFIRNYPGCSSRQIHEHLDRSVSYATVKRALQSLIDQGLISSAGKGKATRYSVSGTYELFSPIDPEDYFQKEIDQRSIKASYDFRLIPEVLANHALFKKAELEKLDDLQAVFRNNLASLSETEYRKEMERLAIDLSWKSSQIEGNTYSLLETERLLREKHTASGKTREEAVMLLNHKETIDFVVEQPDYFSVLTLPKIEDLHRMLVKELSIETNIRNRRVGISGTNYRPLDNDFQLREAMTELCSLINNRENVFERSLLAILLISYIQPFMDGNKRTARLIGNALLIGHGYCPLSYRTVDSIDYKKAMLLFYEQNNIVAFKQIFIGQFEFAVGMYF